LKESDGLGAGQIFAISSALFYSTRSILIRYCLDTGATVAQLVAFRMLFCAVIFFLAVRFFRDASKGPKDLYKHPKILIGSFLFSTAVIASFFSVSYVGVSLAVIVISSHPLFVALFSRIFLSASLTARETFFLITAYFGCALAVLGHPEAKVSGDVFLGGALALLAASSYAGYQLLVQSLSQKVSSLRISAYTAYWSVAPALLLWHFTPLEVPPEALVITAAMGFFSTFMPLLLLAAAISRIGAPRTSIYSLAGPVSALTMAWLLFGETLSPVQMVGAFLVLFSVAMVIFSRLKKYKQSPPSP